MAKFTLYPHLFTFLQPFHTRVCGAYVNNVNESSLYGYISYIHSIAYMYTLSIFIFDYIKITLFTYSPQVTVNKGCRNIYSHFIHIASPQTTVNRGLRFLMYLPIRIRFFCDFVQVITVVFFVNINPHFFKIAIESF